ncbi:MAG: hypothetical protein QOI94_1681, partial [Acidobacteriaceae bacterium]|nr:hypothetical protein [Acidobacteriaceae bacterium]
MGHPSNFLGPCFYAECYRTKA